jgi:hypothetical protein
MPWNKCEGHGRRGSVPFLGKNLIQSFSSILAELGAGRSAGVRAVFPVPRLPSSAPSLIQKIAVSGGRGSRNIEGKLVRGNVARALCGLLTVESRFSIKVILYGYQLSPGQ